jgi:hypothetical protein
MRSLWHGHISTASPEILDESLLPVALPALPRMCLGCIRPLPVAAAGSIVGSAAGFESAGPIGLGSAGW